MSELSLNSVLICVTDLERSKDFYKKVLEIEPMEFTPKLAAFDVKGVLLQLNAEISSPVSLPKHGLGGGTGIHFLVDDIQAVWDRLHGLGISLPEEPTPRPWGLTTFVISDPDGYEVQFQQPLEAA